MYVGIDFGTDGCGLSYGLNDGSVFIHNRWKDACAADEKPETSILFNDKGEPKAYGSKAKQTYIDLHNVNDWMLFEKYKMSLYTEPEWKKEIKTKQHIVPKIDFHENILAANQDKKVATEKIFVAQLKYLFTEAMKFMYEEFKKKRKLKFKSNQIQWILTVPAIWNDAAKNKMKTWAKMAGLIKKENNDPDALKIVYEPDCASLSIQHALIRSLQRNLSIDDDDSKGASGNDTDTSVTSNCDKIAPHRPQISITEQFKEGDKYVIVDVGGGTADIACHKIRGKFEIEELLHPTGGPWGASYIDEEFIQLLNRIFGKNKIDEFKRKNQSMYHQFMSNYKYNSKKTFYDYGKLKRDSHHIQVPRNFVEYLIDQLTPRQTGALSLGPDNMADAFDAFDDDDGDVDETGLGGTEKDDFEYVEEYLKKRSLELYDDEDMITIQTHQYGTYSISFKNKVWTNMFDVVINPLINHVKDILDEDIMSNTNYIFLVGGLASSKYYQQRMKNVFHTTPYSIKVVVPELPQLCVVDGAARYGITPNFMKVRKLSLTYGISAARSLEFLNEADFPKGYIEKHSSHSNVTNKNIVRGCFYKFAEKNKSIHLDDKPIKKSFSKLSKQCNTIDISIYTSNKWNPATVTPEEAKKIGEFRLRFSDESHDTKIMVEFSYHDTTLKVFAYTENNPQKKQEIEVKYH